MHEVAELGFAAHWAYKKGVKGQVDSKESAIGMNWIKELMELQDQSNNAKDFVDSVKRAIWLRKSTSSHRMEQCALCLRTRPD